MKLPDLSALTNVIPLKRTTTNKTTHTLERDEDDMIEMGEEEKHREMHKQLQLQRRQAYWRDRILRVWRQLVVAMVIMVVLICVLIYGLVASRNNAENNNASGNESADKWWTKNSPTYSGNGFEPFPSPTVTPWQPTPFMPGGPALPSIDEQLSKVIDMSLLQDRRTPLGRAYRWIAQQDDMRSVPNYPTVIQRFALAAFYFSTGGGRTSTTWDLCSAVPTDLSVARNGVSSRCVMDDGAEDETVLCAKPEAFLECNEYLEVADLPTPEFPKRRWLSEVSECAWYGVTCNHDGIVEELSLPANGLVGTLPPRLDLLANLRSLDLAGNAMAGELPAWTAWKHMEHIILSSMSLQGAIPESWQAWSELETLDLSDNALTGDVVLPGEWKQLYKVIIANNDFDIVLQANIDKAARLSTLDLAGNNVGGSSLPESITKLENLRTLDLSRCGVGGTIPDGIGQLTNLVELELEGNSFSGTIPEALWQMTNLQVLRLGRNGLSGSLSENVGNLKNLVSFSVAGLYLTSAIPASLGEIATLEQLQLQENAFIGAVPEEVCESPNLVTFWADCAGKESILCSCCTDCCDKKKGGCGVVRR